MQSGVWPQSKIMNHINHGVFFDANRRYDKWEYPLRAVEEALNNALAHRDYFSNAEIQLSIYDNRIEIWNPGELPKPLTPQALKRKHKSIPRNKLLADELFLIKFIEQWGKGTNRIIDEMRQNNLPEPEFQNLSGGFEVTLIGPGKSFEKEIEKEKLHKLDINKRQKKAIEYIKEKEKISNAEYRSIFKVSAATAKRELQDLVKKGICRTSGAGPSLHYLLKWPDYDPIMTRFINGECCVIHCLGRIVRERAKATECLCANKSQLKTENSRIILGDCPLFLKEYLKGLSLNERQILAVEFVKEERKITNKQYREMFSITDRTAHRDLNSLCEKNIFQRIGITGRETKYILTRQKPDKNPTNIPPDTNRHRPNKK